MVKDCKIDQGIGMTVCAFKDDWWGCVMSSSAIDSADVSDRKHVNEVAMEKQALEEILQETLSGEIQIKDGMETIKSGLNICILALKRTGSGSGSGSSSVDWRSWLLQNQNFRLAKSLDNISQQIDAELAIANQHQVEQKTPGKSAEERKFCEELKAAEVMRIHLVADCVKRVRELIASPG